MNESDDSNKTEVSSGINRRRLLRSVGVAAAAFVGVSGTASAHKSKFFGCDRVCTGTQGSYAVVAVDDTFECREMPQASGSEDVPWDWTTYCYEAADDEVVVGLLEENVIEGSTENEDGTCALCLNGNDCAMAAYDSASAVVTALNESDTCGVCAGNVELSSSCTTYTAPASGESDTGDTDGTDTDGSGDDGSDSGNGDDESSDDSSDSGGGDEGESDNGSDDSDGDQSPPSNGQGSDGGDQSADPSEETNLGRSRNNRPGNDYDIDADYRESRDPTREYPDVDLEELAERRAEQNADDGPAWECDYQPENRTAMERWYDRDDTPADPQDRNGCENDTEEPEGTMTAMERWFARSDTPSFSEAFDSDQ